MSVTVKLRYLRHSARKLRPYTRVVAGKSLEDAINQMAVMPQDSAKYIGQALSMAKSAAVAKEFLPENMIVSAISASEGPKVKRVRPNARGRGNAYFKHLAHLLVTLDEKKAPAVKKTAKPVKKAKTEEKI